MKNILNKIFNRNKTYEDLLLKQYGKANELKKYNLKILFIADTHDCLRNDTTSIDVIKKSNYDYCILLGDHSPNDLDIILEIVPLEKICGILGNHDGWEKYSIYGIKDINGKVIDIKGVKIAGLSGSYKYKNSNDYALYNHEESIEIVNKMRIADIFISHDKPFTEDNHNPAHDGLKGVTEYIYKNHIPLHIHGHIHIPGESILKNGTKSICLFNVNLLEL